MRMARFGQMADQNLFNRHVLQAQDMAQISMLAMPGKADEFGVIA